MAFFSKPESDPLFSVLIPSWNNLEMLKLCLQSLEQNSSLPLEVVVHVNEGQDGTIAWLTEQQIVFTESPTNIGISAGLNLAYTKAQAEYIVYLNDDMYVLPGWDQALYQSQLTAEPEQIVYSSGTMIQPFSMSPIDIVRNYGDNTNSFDEQQLLSDHADEQLNIDDWNGATWPPSCLHRRWWDAVGGYSHDLGMGLYSDIDFSMKLWSLGRRRFLGCGSSLVYHFPETSTRKLKHSFPQESRQSRRKFLNKWGILPSSVSKYILHSGDRFLGETPEPSMFWERLRIKGLTSYYGLMDHFTQRTF